MVDMLETAGTDAAQPSVLRLCRRLYEGVPESDPLLKMLFARVGFLQPVLWARASQETQDFLTNNPEVAAILLRETAARRQDDFGVKSLPSMERGWFAGPLIYPPGGPMDPMHVAAGRMYAPRPRW
jgi:hypothetical protein